MDIKLRNLKWEKLLKTTLVPDFYDVDTFVFFFNEEFSLTREWHKKNQALTEAVLLKKKQELSNIVRLSVHRQTE